MPNDLDQPIIRNSRFRCITGFLDVRISKSLLSALSSWNDRVDDSQINDADHETRF